MNRLLLADAMELSPGSSTFRDLVAASVKYGFTRGNFNSTTIELTELGEALTKPRNQEERLNALRDGMQSIALFEQILEYFDNSKLPDPQFLCNTLEREPFNVSPEWAQEGAEVFTKNGREVGFIRTISGSPHVIIEAGPPTEDSSEDISTEAVAANGSIDGIDGTVDQSDTLGMSSPAPEPSLEISTAEVSVETALPEHSRTADTPKSRSTPPESRQFFIAHGWDKEALQQLQNILNRFRIPYVVAQEEPNIGRPISQKVRELMKSCSAGIFIFSADEELKDKDGNAIWRPRENVIYELGAGSLEYGQRIVVFKEKSVYFPTDFRDIGYIEYEKGNLQARAVDLLMELVALGAVQITPAELSS